VRGTILVAVLSSVGLAGAAALVSRVLWRSAEEKTLADTAQALAAMIEGQAQEDGITLEEAGPEAIEDSAIVGYRIELWSGGKLVTPAPSATPLGPPPAGPSYYSRGGCLVRAQPLTGGLVILLGAPEEAERRALRIFAWSLGFSLPFCLLLAAGVGWIVGRRATRPLVDFTARVTSIRDPRERGGAGREPAGSLGRGGTPGATPAEIEDLEDAFGHLLDRLAETLRREVEFAANASHELRTPLTTVRLYAEEASRGAPLAIRDALALQIHEIDRVVRLIDSLLVMAKDSESGFLRGEAVNLADVVREAAARTFSAGPAGAAPTLAALHLPDELFVRGDENLLGIAVENLLDNARKFTPDGRTIEVLCEQSGKTVRLVVTSPGARIGTTESEALFERFHRTPEARASHPGHGLGLPLARHIARVHGGDVRCASKPAEDACFVLELPAWEPEAPPAFGAS